MRRYTYTSCVGAGKRYFVEGASAIHSRPKKVKNFRNTTHGNIDQMKSFGVQLIRSQERGCIRYDSRI